MIDSVLKIINKFVPDQESRDRLKSELTKEVTKQMELQSDIIKNEQKSDSWLTKNWRPLFAAACGLMICTHWALYDVLPYIRTAFDLNFWIPQDPGMDPELWTTMRLCLGGYIGSRSAEKIVKIIRS
jgi:hypothetical protein